MVMSNFSSSIPDPSQDGAKWLRIFWAVLTALLTIAMLVAGGVTTMEYATLIFALPVTIIAYLVMASFSKALRMERAEREGQVLRRQSTAAHGGHVPERTWRQRLARMRSYPSKKQVAQFMERTVRPALDDVLKEFTKQGYEATLDARAERTQPASPAHAGGRHSGPPQLPLPGPGRGGAGADVRRHACPRETDVYYRVRGVHPDRVGGL